MEHTGHYKADSGVSVRVQELTARNLQLLQAIESTITALSSDVKLLDAVAAGFGEMFDRLQANVPDAAIDPEGRVCNALSLAADSAQRMHAKATGQHKAACDDPQLTHEDGIVDAYEDYLSGLERLFDTVETLRDWVETHDALLEPSTGNVHKNVDDLFAAMGL